MPVLRIWLGILLGSLVVLAPLPSQAPKPDRALAVKPASQRPAVQEARVALVIGNGAYKDAPLKNPVNDARSMTQTLRSCGFTVIALENASFQKMREALRDFGGRISKGGVGLFYFAGHGMQVKGKNYLIPIGADIAAEDEVAGAALDVDSVLSKLETARNRLNILILDACRNNPFGRSFRGSQSGLAPLDAPTGTFIAFATAPGRTAADGNKNNGLYTEQLLSAIRTPGLKLEDTFKHVLTGVRIASKDQQVPWISSSVEGDFYFMPGGSSQLGGSASSMQVDSTGADIALWNTIKETGSQDEFQAYLDRFPDGMFAKPAATRIAAFQAAKEEEELKKQGIDPAVPLNLDQVRSAILSWVGSQRAKKAKKVGLSEASYRVVLDVLISEEGNVVGTQVLQAVSNDALNGQCLEAANTLRFLPAKFKNGKVVKVWQTVLLHRRQSDSYEPAPNPRIER